MIESVRDGICHVSIIQICLPRSNLTAAMICDVSHVRIVQVVEHATILKDYKNRQKTQNRLLKSAKTRPEPEPDCLKPDPAN